MENLILVRFMVRAFGLFLLTVSVGKLPNVIYTLVTGEYSSFTQALFAGAVPYFIPPVVGFLMFWKPDGMLRSEEHTSELQSLMRISYAVFCLKKKKQTRKRNI